jgi:MFS transporter, FHS family, L-fucose permease
LAQLVGTSHSAIPLASAPIETDTRAMTVATALLFMVGFLTCLNDVTIPHLKSIFELSYAEAMLV